MKTRNVIFECVKVKELKDGDFEGTKWFQLIEDCDMVKPKHKMTGSCYMKAIDDGINSGDILDLIVELDYYPKNNCYVLGKVIDFSKSKVK